MLRLQFTTSEFLSIRFKQKNIFKLSIKLFFLQDTRWHWRANEFRALQLGGRN